MNFKEKRRNHLMENISRQYKLLHEYERKRDLSDRPKEIEAFNSEITAIANSLEDYIAQYNRICQDDNTSCSPEVASIWNEIQHLKQGQQLIVQKQDETLAAIDRVRHEISMKIEDSYRSLALNLLLALDEQEVRVVGAIIDGIEKNQLSEKEMAEALKAIQTGYAELQAKSLLVSSTTGGAEDTKQLPQVWNSPDLNAGGKLKLSIPLIPAILSYETELSVSVKQSLSLLWGRFFKGKQILI
jgi:cytochrome c556